MVPFIWQIQWNLRKCTSRVVVSCCPSFGWSCRFTQSVILYQSANFLLAMTYFTKEVNPYLIQRPLKFNDGAVKLGLTSLVDFLISLSLFIYLEATVIVPGLMNNDREIGDQILISNMLLSCKSHVYCNWSNTMADSRLAPSQWETSLQSNAVTRWLGANIESTL